MAAKNSPSPDTGTDGLVPTFVASLAILMAGLLLLGLATDGGRGFTTETLRRSEVSREARALPDFGLIDQNDRTTGLHALLAQDNKVWIVDFIYTRCTTVCSALGSVYQQLQRRIVERGLQNRIGLLSIRFCRPRSTMRRCNC